MENNRTIDRGVNKFFDDWGLFGLLTVFFTTITVTSDIGIITNSMLNLIKISLPWNIAVYVIPILILIYIYTIKKGRLTKINNLLLIAFALYFNFKTLRSHVFFESFTSLLFLSISILKYFENKIKNINISVILSAILIIPIAMTTTSGIFPFLRLDLSGKFPKPNATNVKLVLNNKNLEYATLNISFENVDLKGSDFSYAKSKNLNFNGSNLENCIFDSTKLNNAFFSKSTIFFNTNFTRADLTSASFSNSFFKGDVCFKNSILNNVKFDSCHLYKAKSLTISQLLNTTGNHITFPKYLLKEIIDSIQHSKSPKIYFRLLARGNTEKYKEYISQYKNNILKHP